MTFSQFSNYVYNLSCLNYTGLSLIYAEYYAEISLEGHPKAEQTAKRLLSDGFYQPNKDRFVFGIHLEDD